MGKNYMWASDTFKAIARSVSKNYMCVYESLVSISSKGVRAYTVIQYQRRINEAPTSWHEYCNYSHGPKCVQRAFPI